MGDQSIEQIQAMRQGNIGRLFLRAHRAYSTRATAMLRKRGHEGLNLEHTSVLAHIDIEGTHITTLAARAGIRKQTMGQLVTELEQKGYVERVSDPTDKRALLVNFTAKGQQFLRDAYVIKVELEAEYIRGLGKGAYETLYQLLGQFVDAFEAGKGEE